MNTHRGVAGDDRDQGALVVGIKMLNQHEGHAGVGWHLREKHLEGIDTARRGAEANDQPGSIRYNGRRSGSLSLGSRPPERSDPGWCPILPHYWMSWHYAPWE